MSAWIAEHMEVTVGRCSCGDLLWMVIWPHEDTPDRLHQGMWPNYMSKDVHDRLHDAAKDYEESEKSDTVS